MHYQELITEPSVVDLEGATSGVSNSILSPSDFEKVRPVIVSTAKDIAREGGSPSDWFDPWNTEKCLKINRGFQPHIDNCSYLTAGIGIWGHTSVRGRG